MGQLGNALARWEAAWEALGVPVATALHPGAEPDHVRHLLSQSLGSAPEPLVDWFCWHNGADMPWVAAPTQRELLSLEAALEDRTHNMSLPTTTDSGEPLPHWQSTWLPLLRASNGGSLAFDAATGSLLLVDFWNADFATLAASDLPTAVTLWSALVEAGHFAWNGAGWTYEYLDLPLAARTSNLL